MERGVAAPRDDGTELRHVIAEGVTGKPIDLAGAKVSGQPDALRADELLLGRGPDLAILDLITGAQRTLGPRARGTTRFTALRHGMLSRPAWTKPLLAECTAVVGPGDTLTPAGCD